MQDRWDRFIWLIVMLPLLVFFLMTVLISLYLEQFTPWRGVVPVILGFGVFFLVLGYFLRSRFGRMAL
ncbi:MAG: hypothetical protein RXS23_04250 [Metallosphaera yellowstonensis]|jgi:hypothetical protein|uniref:Uncharacterized protein n=1 Tax=Metallosphaera yellowstonensis MK1 TaxID=671065 RepID=H2C7N6_9CREN|nr:hypothetical protein [Metallosphaera yellowstonensis]EHP68162.1 hypothetical protein MetMK1DRAFT_00025850 [Metallosphaera yellowstonensis MK1]